MANPLMQENVWLQKQRFEEAEAYFYAVQAGTAQPGAIQGGGSSLRNEISEARQQIQNALKQPLIHCTRTSQGGQGGASPQVQNRLDELEKENKDLKKVTNDLKALVQKLESRVVALEGGKGKGGAPASKAAANDDDDDFDLFGDDDEEDQKMKEERKAKMIADYTAKKSKKPALIAKSSVVLDIKPWDDETDMKEMERLVRSIQKDGLVWGAAKLQEVAYGLKKLTIICIVEDEKIGVEDLREEIEQFEDLVQSVDIAAFNKI
ncbi:elongation factor 1-beta-like isoform X1 [Littorina saxatilis]|uniref:Translation elongation factor EF1B beta/delta subunit guanine nucleotide exchange domain-containing protein n=1 Tax=Littorina saxatilis TaxID=31220 RepID=A0AAN9ASJ8_9CAEN